MIERDLRAVSVGAPGCWRLTNNTNAASATADANVNVSDMVTLIGVSIPQLAAHFLKMRAPHSEVVVKDLQTEELTVVAARD